MENEPLSESKSDSAGQSEIDSLGESESHLPDESASDSWNDSWNDLPDADGSAVSISFLRSAPRCDSSTAKGGDNREAAVRDAHVCAITEEWSAARCNERSFGRRFVVSPRENSPMRFGESFARRSQMCFHRSYAERDKGTERSRDRVEEVVQSGAVEEAASCHSERSEESSR